MTAVALTISLARFTTGAFAALVIMLWPQLASAHATLVASVPASGATVAAPTMVMLTFNEDVKPVVAKLTQIGGGAALEIKAEAAGTMVHYMIQGTLAPGQYELAYRVVSPDSHPAAGSVTFTVKPAAK